MGKKNLNTTGAILEKIMHVSFFLYLFLLIFPHTTTPKEISFWIATLCWIVVRLRKPEPFITFNPIIISLSLFMFIAFISSVIGMEPLENLKRFKGELLVPFVLFLITVTEFNSIEKIKRLLFAPLIAFAIYTLLAIIESTGYGLHYFWDKINREQYVWLTSYSQISAITFPIILGLILFVTNRALKYFLIIFAIVEFSILTAYGGFTVFLGAVSMLLLWIMFVKSKKYRLWMIAFISLFIFIFALLSHTYRDNPAITEYRDKFKRIINISDEFRSEGGFSNRMPAWKAAVDVIKDKPLLGYGWGMKNYPDIIQQKKISDKWKITRPEIYKFNSHFKDKFFPPHNLFLEIAVQSGLSGLTAFIIFISMYLYCLIKNSLHNGSGIDRNFSIILIGGTLLSFMIMNLMSNELGNISGKILFVVLGMGAAWIEAQSSKHSAHPSVG